MLLGNFNPYTEKLEIPKSYQVFSNFKKRVLNPAYKELKEKGDYYFEYELIKREKKYLSLNFSKFLKIGGRGKKFRKDFSIKKGNFLFYSGLDLGFYLGFGRAFRKNSLSFLLYNFISVFFITLSLSVDFRHILIS